MNHLEKNMPKLGFGLMRLPMQEGAIDVEQVKEMVDLFLEAGFTYFDTAYGYNGGESERSGLFRLFPAAQPGGIPHPVF